MKFCLSIILKILLSLVFLLAFIWIGCAFFYQLPVSYVVLVILWGLLALFAIYSLIGEWGHHPWRTRILVFILFIAVGFWWSTIHPSLDKDWDPALSKTVEGSREGSLLHIRNIRDFKWKTPESGEEHWFDATYNLDEITGVNLYLSYWMGPYIAHTLIGFTFSDGRELLFSSEIRREKGEEFSAIGGFFKEFELAMLAATPDDIIKLRSDVRKEDIFRYQLEMTPEQARSLINLYLETANKFAHKAGFYNTVTTNCTTVVFDMVRILEPKLPVDWRILLSGKLSYYLYDHQFINTSLPVKETIEKAYIGKNNPIPPDLLPQ